MPTKKNSAGSPTVPAQTAVSDSANEAAATPDAVLADGGGKADENTAGRLEPTDYKAVFSSAAGVELGEDLRFRQRVIRFKERPDAQTLDTLKDNGFTYRPREKAWTVPATPESRAFTDRLVREMNGGERER